jgi:hypothetical protein
LTLLRGVSNSPKTAPENFRGGDRIAKGEVGIKAPPAAAFDITVDADKAWVDSKTTAQPVGTYTEKASYTGGREKIARKTFIRAKGYKSAAFDANWPR